MAVGGGRAALRAHIGLCALSHTRPTVSGNNCIRKPITNMKPRQNILRPWPKTTFDKGCIVFVALQVVDL
eukprot:scaffold15599_cov54-Attheya_sp.AAC.3